MASVQTEDVNGVFGKTNLFEHKTDYYINGLGERVAKSGNDAFGFFDVMSGAVEYAYDEAGHLIGEYDARGNVIEETVYLGDIPVAVMEGGFNFGHFGFGQGGQGVYYITADNLGSPHIVADAHNRKLWEWHHAPFGDTEPVSTEGFSYNLRLPGQVRDQESGLNYNFFRDYDSHLGRYVQSDPMGVLAGINTYGYVGQSPLISIDPRALATYILNRTFDLPLIPWSPLPSWYYVSHTIVFVTNPDGSITTYGWGERPDLDGWSVDQPIDMSTAKQSLQDGEAQLVGGNSFDSYIAQAFGQLNNPIFRHSNGVLYNNCKAESNDLINTANYLQLINPTILGVTPLGEPTSLWTSP